MAALESCPKHNMIAYLDKTEGNVEFHEVIDFLRRSYIYHALTVSGQARKSTLEAKITNSRIKLNCPTNISKITKDLSLQLRLPRRAPQRSKGSTKSSVSKQGRKIAKRIIKFKEILYKEIDEVRLSTDKERVSTDFEKVSTDFEKVSTDRPIVSTDGSKVSTDEQVEEKLKVLAGQTKSQAKAASKEKEKGVELKDVEEIDRPRPTTTRSLLTLKPLPKIDPKDKGKKKIEE
ncbi:hypothetical protein Tco_0037768 [Tanacetum coccineum]